MTAAPPADDNTWAELEATLGREAAAVVDHAVCAALANYAAPIKPDEHYLVSEHISFSVLIAMRDAGLRFGDVVDRIERRECPVCKASVTITGTGKVRRHRRRDGAGGFCPSGGLPNFRVVPPAED